MKIIFKSNPGHAGRKGERGGSAPKGTSGAEEGKPTDGKTYTTIGSQTFQHGVWHKNSNLPAGVTSAQTLITPKGMGTIIQNAEGYVAMLHNQGKMTDQQIFNSEYAAKAYIMDKMKVERDPKAGIKQAFDEYRAARDRNAQALQDAEKKPIAEKRRKVPKTQ